MESKNLAIAEEYYTLVCKKDSQGIKKYLHPQAEFHSPLASLKGIDAIVEATSKFMNAFQTLTIRAKLSGSGQAMIVYDTNIPGINQSFPGASLLTFREGLIIRIELFHDASPFAVKKKEVFS